jgi:predicted transglutaminase-like cysteine proteinase
MMVDIVIFRILRLKSAILLIAALTANAVDALPAAAESERFARVLVSEITQPPPGWVEFCARQPSECTGPETAPRKLALSVNAWMELVRVNKWVNETIKPLTDLEHWNVVERWSYPDDGYGDCEDYVLLKRRILLQYGWPREALLVTVVRDKKGEGHAVLMVTTEKGDYVLDNQNKDVLLWSQTGYRFVKRQSQSHPGVWVLLGDPRPPIATATSSGSRSFHSGSPAKGRFRR